MFVHKTRYLKFDAIQVWWPQSVADITPLLQQAPVVILWQCPEALLPAFRPWVFRSKVFHTPLVDLRRSSEELWEGLDPKSCRYEIRKAQKLDCAISLNEESDAARVLLNDSIRRLQYRGELGLEEWRALRPAHDIFLCRCQGTPIAVHVMLRDSPRRVRLLMSGSADRSDPQLRNRVGPCNRLLHWHELQHYQQQGVHFYDFGGCDIDKNAPEYSIGQFKLSFGGQVVTEPLLYLAGKPALRLFLRTLSATRSSLRRLPWPETWVKAIRTHPKLGSLVR